MKNSGILCSFLQAIPANFNYTWKEHDKHKKCRSPQQPQRPAAVPTTTLVYTIPTIRQLEVMFPNFTEVTLVQCSDQLPPSYADVSMPPPSYDQIQIDVRFLNDKKVVDHGNSNEQNPIT
ncbi:uncharacterized protein LOC119658318 isoform X2 [Hermetia illucens]|uniref:uncharacterized protein LOC119658318 isoform X2 n=1 Tax=Hermetia illucens TaxID=343691 RepID=UPI0018CC6E4D|nr:uncharacterized protein LOC119658318 isoform X2 [Hermetia illucens]